MRTGQHLKNNQKKLDTTSEAQWADALIKCKNHIIIKLRKRTFFGAHAEERLGMDPVDFYVSFAYEALLDGNWEWKDGRTLGQQMIRIADNRIGKEVEKYKIEQKNEIYIVSEEFVDYFYSENIPTDEHTLEKESEFSKKISIIENAVNGDENLEMFWECIMECMKRDEIANFMEKNPKQIDKIREKLISKIKSSPYFDL